MRISLQPAFILHHRPYRETSLLLDVFSQDHGRVALIAKGIRKNRSPLRALLQPFFPLLLSWQGRSELMTLQIAEPQGAPIHLQGECLLSGFYLNELLSRLLQKYDPHPQLYTIYHHTLLELDGIELQQKHLRLFEKKLLHELGYGLQLQQPFVSDRFYRFYPDQGFELYENNTLEHGMIFSGKSLLALAHEQLNDDESLRDAKRLMRIALGIILGPMPLHSRKLFTGVKG
jgi:DNA repair protein RecO (recombination protein O)